MSEIIRRPGEFVWRELHCRDAAAARHFYTALFEWQFERGPVGGMDYWLIQGPAGPIGGLMQLAAGEPSPPHWMTFISVENVDETAARAQASGGTVAFPPTDIPEVGRFAAVGDPTGAIAGVLWQRRGDGPRAERPALGTFCWESLHTTDIEAAKAFYLQAIGWRDATTEQMAVLAAGETQVCDLEAAMPGMPSFWLSHVVVQHLDRARETMEVLGGRALVPRLDIPHVGSICVFTDLEGTVLSMFQPQF